MNLSSVMNMYSITTHLSHPYKSQENEAAVAIEKQEAWYKYSNDRHGIPFNSKKYEVVTL